LKSAGVHTVRDLVQRTEADIMQVKNFGKKSLTEVKTVLANLNPPLSLGMKLDEKGQVLR
jgi:DNA-directed RNA polymerase subunit alpha